MALVSSEWVLTLATFVEGLKRQFVIIYAKFMIRSQEKLHFCSSASLVVEHVGYIMGLTHIIFNKLNKTLWYVTLSVVWFNII